MATPPPRFPKLSKERPSNKTHCEAGHRTRVHPITGLPFIKPTSRPEDLPQRPRLAPPLEPEASSNPATAPPCQSGSFPLPSSTPVSATPSEPVQPSATAGRVSTTSTVRRRKQEQVTILNQSRLKIPGCFPPPIADASAALPRRLPLTPERPVELPTVSSQGKRARK